MWIVGSFKAFLYVFLAGFAVGIVLMMFATRNTPVQPTQPAQWCAKFNCDFGKGKDHG
jgi:hypothetical protein